MPIRHHCPPPTPFLSFLKRNDCILYSPLSQTDTTDWISGNQIIPYGNGSMTWDSARSIWKFQKLSSQSYGTNSWFAKWQLKIPIEQQEISWSCCVELFAYYYTYNYYSAYETLPTRSAMWSLHGTYNQLTQSAHSHGSENNRTIWKGYKNGTQVYTYTYSSIRQLIYTTDICIGMRPNSDSQFSGPYGIRNIAIFAKTFSLNDINEYFALLPS